MTTEGFFVEINSKEKSVLCCSYNPKKSLISEYLNEIDNYDNMIILC